MTQPRLLFTAALTLALSGAFACSLDRGTPTGPLNAGPTAATKWSSRDGYGHPAPSSHEDDASASSLLVRCQERDGGFAEGDVGPAGGRIVVGRNRLIVPAGALASTVHITATVPEGHYAQISFEPEGLVFDKPARLVLDAAGCAIPEGTTPDVVYINRAGEIAERIQGSRNGEPQSVTAPIHHFSSYALAW